MFLHSLSLYSRVFSTFFNGTFSECFNGTFSECFNGTFSECFNGTFSECRMLMYVKMLCKCEHKISFHFIHSNFSNQSLV